MAAADAAAPGATAVVTAAVTAAASATASATDFTPPPTSYASGVVIVGLSAALALAMEGFTWLTVYRKEEYVAAKARVTVLAERRTFGGGGGGGE